MKFLSENYFSVITKKIFQYYAEMFCVMNTRTQNMSEVPKLQVNDRISLNLGYYIVS